MSTDNTTIDGPTPRVDDPEDYTQNERLKQLMRSRQQVSDVRSRAREMRLNHSINEEREALYYRTAVENYLMELRPLFHQNDSSRSSQFWTEEKLGEVTISPFRRVNNSIGPAEYILTKKYRSSDEATRYAEVNPERKQIEVVGLTSVLELPERLSGEFECVTQSAVSGKQPETRSLSTVIHKPVLDKAVQVADRFRSELGIDLDSGGEQDVDADPF